MGVEHLPQYRSHKVVRAGVFLGDTVEDDGRLRLIVSAGDNEIANVMAPAGIFARGAPTHGQDYIVVYEDGYVSWSPKAAFEEGYSSI